MKIAHLIDIFGDLQCYQISTDKRNGIIQLYTFGSQTKNVPTKQSKLSVALNVPAQEMDVVYTHAQ